VEREGGLGVRREGKKGRREGDGIKSKQRAGAWEGRCCCRCSAREGARTSSTATNKVTQKS